MNFNKSLLGYLIASLRLALDSGDESDIALLDKLNKLDQPDKLNKLLALAKGHLVIGLLFKGLQYHPVLLQQFEKNSAAHRLRKNLALRAIQQLKTLQQINTLFSQTDIAYLTLKGKPLSQSLYGDLFASESGDIDVLVHPQQLNAAEQVLCMAGWHREHSAQQTPVQNRWYQQYKKERVLLSPNGRIEIHQRLFENPYYYHADFTPLYANASTVNIGTLAFPTLSPVDALVYISCHAAKHHFARIKWLCDCATLLKHTTTNDLEQAIAIYRQSSLDGVFYSTQLLVQNTLHITPAPERKLPPAHYLTAFRSHQFVYLSSRSWHLAKPDSCLKRMFFTFLLKPDFKLLVHDIKELATSPRDWQMIKLPDRLFFVYFLLRPFCYLLRIFRRARTQAKHTNPDLKG